MSETFDCPFCGSHMIAVCDEESDGERRWFVRCTQCCSSTGHYDSHEGAIDAWNTRVEVKP
jgi:transcription elongation factor Elf1